MNVQHREQSRTAHEGGEAEAEADADADAEGLATTTWRRFGSACCSFSCMITANPAASVNTTLASLLFKRYDTACNAHHNTHNNTYGPQNTKHTKHMHVSSVGEVRIRYNLRSLVRPRIGAKGERNTGTCEHADGHV